MKKWSEILDLAQEIIDHINDCRCGMTPESMAAKQIFAISHQLHFEVEAKVRSITAIGSVRATWQFVEESKGESK